MRPPLWLRRLLRPLVPDRLMALARLREHSRQVRTNVDVVVDRPREQRRWLATTPDTYRVRDRASFGPAPDLPVTPLAVGLPPGGPVAAATDRELGPQDVADLARPLADTAVDVVVLGGASAPRLVARRRVEPRVEPHAVAARREAWDEVGGFDGSEPSLPVMVERLRATGRRFALVPRRPSAPAPLRHDRIRGPGSAVVLALVPMHDVGGGSRGAQLALELLRRDWHVTYVALYPTAESVDVGIRFIHPRLEQRRVDELDLDGLAARLATPARAAIVELPAREYLAPARRLRELGHRLVYDLIDDWSAPSLGGRWYRAEVEEEFTRMADALVASASPLAARLRRTTGRTVELVPNAVNAALFAGEAGPRPHDLPPEEPIIGYHGSLYGDWFDWGALREVAGQHPNGQVVVIGDEPGSRPEMPANVRFLGLKPLVALPAYLARFDVGIIPFVVSDVTHAVSPLKAYEYLATGVPVAAPPLEALAGLEGVHTAERLVDAVSAALGAPRPDRRAALAAHSWATRVDLMFAAAGLDRPDVAGRPARIAVRPPLHYARRDRRVRSG